jgi:hypothetical protein
MMELPFNKNLLRKVDELRLPTRLRVCLKNDGIVYIGDLVQRSEGEMLRTPKFGRTSLTQLKEALAWMGLHFGMEIPDWEARRRILESARPVALPASWSVHCDEDGSCSLQIELGADYAVLLTASVEDGPQVSLSQASGSHPFEETSEQLAAWCEEVLRAQGGPGALAG